MGRVVVLGSSNTDLVLQTSKLPGPGETVLGSKFFQAAGGKGANQAVAAARAGAEVAFLAALGDDPFGEQAYAALAAENLDLRYVQRLGGVSSGVALILVDESGQNQIAVGPGANAQLSESFIDALPAELFRSGSLFVTQLETPNGAVLAGLQRAKLAEMTTLFNPAPPKAEVGNADWLHLVDVLVVNEHEAREIAGLPIAVDDQRSVAEAAQRLRSLGCRDVVITLGSGGYALASAGDVQFHPAYAVQVVDTVAAGDAFVGTLACFLSEGMSLADASQKANKAAAIAVTRVGAQPSLPRREEIERFTL